MHNFRERLRCYFRIYLFLLISAFLASCAGTGTRSISLIQRVADDNSATAVIVLRDTGTGGLAALIDITVDGSTIATLGNREMTAYRVEPGNYELQAAFTGISGLGLNKPIRNFEIEKGEKKYFVVRLPSNGTVLGFADYTVTLIEISRREFLGR